MNHNFRLQAYVHCLSRYIFKRTVESLSTLKVLVISLKKEHICFAITILMYSLGDINSF